VDGRNPSASIGSMGISLGRIFGIRVRLHPSVLVIVALILVSLAQGAFRNWHPDWPWWTAWATAFVATVLFLASLLTHELAHSLVARRRGIAVPQITLFVFGGVAEIAAEPTEPRSEFVIAIVGPLTSVAIALAFAFVGAWLVPIDFVARVTADPAAAMAGLTPFATICVWLAPVNLMLAIFNLVPGFPLDGGRVLRALLWWWSGDQVKATRLAAGCGRAVSWLLIAWGVLDLFGGRALEGLWLIVIGIFLGNAATSGYQQLLVRRSLHGLVVADLMRTHFESVEPTCTLGDFVDRLLLRSAQTSWPVVADGRAVGVIAQRDVAQTAEADRARLQVRDVMRPLGSVPVLAPGLAGPAALERIAEMADEPLPVVDHGAIVGLLHASDIFRWLSLHRLHAVP
jgi:Zn-dependent protease/predicted transcriptional regulator